MTQEISSLMDGELEAHEAERAIRSCCASSEAARTWHDYHLIGDVMRAGSRTRIGHRRARARSRSSTEPAILAPRRAHARVHLRRAWRSPRPPRSPRSAWSAGSAARAAPGPPRSRWSPRTRSRDPAGRRHRPRPRRTPLDVQDYLAAHRQLPSPDLYRPVEQPGHRRPRLDDRRGGRRACAGVLPALALGFACARRPPAPTIRSPGCSAPPQAARSVTYAGIFVHTNGERTSTVRITHLNQGGEEHERIEPLDGAAPSRSCAATTRCSAASPTRRPCASTRASPTASSPRSSRATPRPSPRATT